MPERSPRPPAVYAWTAVFCLVGLDYFSTLAYLPSVAVEGAGSLAPLAAIGVVLVTILGALPVYAYVVGRSSNGEGAIGLLEKHSRGWAGKVLILVLLGFVATDFVITRTLSVADAAVHCLGNPYWRQHATWVVQNRETVRAAFPTFLQGAFFDFWNEQLVLAVILSVTTFGLYNLLFRGFTKTFLRLGVVVVAVYLLLDALIVGSCLFRLWQDPTPVIEWWGALPRSKNLPFEITTIRFPNALGVLMFLAVPQLALGLSGFELSMASVPLLRMSPGDDPNRPRGRIDRARGVLLAAVVVMGFFVIASVWSVSLLLTDGHGGPEPAHARFRSLAYIAHGERLADPNRFGPMSFLFGEVFGTVYDVVTVLMLCLAGASAAVGLRDLIPRYLARYGMQLRWAQKTNLILHLFNVVILIVVVAFRADVSDQQWAYATSVLALLTSASLAVLLDLSARWRGKWLRPVVLLPFTIISLFFVTAMGTTLLINRTGLLIASLFVLLLMVTAFLSRWVRSNELRFDGFTFADEAVRARWEEICKLEFQVLMPHRPGPHALSEKEAEIRRLHRLGADVPIIFIEAERGDPSDFLNAPLMHISHEDGREVVRVSRCASVAHVLAAVALQFREVGRPPEIHFGWSDENPLTANVNFLLMGEGNIPWIVHALLRRAEPNPERRPRVVVG